MPIETLTNARVLTMLAATPPRIAVLTAGTPPEQLQTTPEPGEWSANEVLAHLRACADMWGGCIAEIIAHDHPTLRAVNPRTWIDKTDYREQPFLRSLDVFTTQRAELLEILESLAPEGWDRAATITGAGRPLERTVRFYAQWLANHERPHVKQLERIVNTKRADASGGLSMQDKQGALVALRREFARWEAMLAGLTEAQLTAPEFAEGWSIKDVVAHLRAWQQRSVARLEAALHNRAPEYPAWPEQFDPEVEGQPHDLNEWLYEQTRDQPWPGVYRDWREGFLRLIELAEAVPEADLLAAGRHPWLEGHSLLAVLQGTHEHHQEHAEFLAPVLTRLGRSSGA